MGPILEESLMALTFVALNPEENGELPWVNEYLDMHPETKETFVSPIQEIVITSKGYMLIALDYKGFLFKDSKIAKFLEEAILFWKSDPKNAQLPGIFLSCSSKPTIAFDDDIKGTVAIFENKGKKISIQWDKKSKKQTTGNLEINPFLKKASERKD